jgi:hypothetical protein
MPGNTFIEWTAERALCLSEEGETTILLGQDYIDVIDLFPNVTRRVSYAGLSLDGKK